MSQQAMEAQIGVGADRLDSGGIVGTAQAHDEADWQDRTIEDQPHLDGVRR
jgi:hypothetical protein